jgi:hypothetical protein
MGKRTPERISASTIQVLIEFPVGSAYFARPMWGAVTEGGFTYDSGSAPSKKSGCHFAQALLSERRSAAGDATKIKHLPAPGVRNDPNLEPTPESCPISPWSR